MVWKKPISKKDKINILTAIPVRAANVKTMWKDEYAVLVFPRKLPHILRLLLLPFSRKSPVVHVELEEHGTAVWQLIDGKRTVEDIILALESHFCQQPGYEARITTYLLQMQKDGFIRLFISSDS